MARVILFGGGDGGGFIIGPRGIEPIPPWTPKVAHALKAIAALANVSAARDISLEADSDIDLSGFDAASVAGDLASQVIPGILRSAGFDAESDGGETSVFYAGFEGDFTCGSTGLRPFPRPRPKFLAEISQEFQPG